MGARVLVPTVALVVVPVDGPREEGPERDDEAVLHVEEIPSGPLSLANAIARTPSSGG